jgi:hypothetical protein
MRDFLTFDEESLKYLEKWFDFSDSCAYKIQLLSLEKEPTYSDFKESVAVLNLKTSFSMEELYKEFYIIKPTFALFLNDKSEHTFHL